MTEPHPRTRREKIYAIIRTGGKQYRVSPDQVIDVERLPVEVGSTIELNDVLLIANNGEVTVGRPRVEGARVVAEVVEHGRDKKVIVFKYKAKTRYRRKRGHRQGYTRLVIRQILTEAVSTETAVEKPKRTRRASRQEKPSDAPRRTRRKRAAEAPASGDAESKGAQEEPKQETERD